MSKDSSGDFENSKMSTLDSLTRQVSEDRQILSDLSAIMPNIELLEVTLDDLEELVAIRIAAMRESLERVGRFNPVRARERLVSSFRPDHARLIVCGGERVGFYSLRATEADLQLDHLYILPSAQGQGIGSWVLRGLLVQSDRKGVPIRLGALKESPANDFYRRHGFEVEGESEWDIHYCRKPQQELYVNAEPTMLLPS